MDNQTHRLHIAESHIALLQEQMQGLANTVGNLRHDLENASLDSEADLEWLTTMSKRIERLEDLRETSAIEALSLVGRIIDLDDRVDALESTKPSDIGRRLADLQAEREAIWDDADSRSATLSLDEMDRVEEISRAIEELESLGTEGVTIADLQAERKAIWDQHIATTGTLTLSDSDRDRIAEIDRRIKTLEGATQGATEDETVEDSLAALKSDSEDVERELFIMGKDLHGLRMKLEKVVDEIEKAVDEQRTVFDSLERLDDEMADLRDDHSDHDEILREFEARFTSRLTAIESRLEDLTEQAEIARDFESQIDDLESRAAEIDEIEGRVDDLESAISHINVSDLESAEDIQERVESLEGLVEREIKARGLESSLSETSLSDLEALESRVGDLEILQERVDSLNRGADYLDNQVNELENQLKDEVDKADDAFGHTQALIGDLQQNIIHLQRVASRQGAEIKALKDRTLRSRLSRAFAFVRGLPSRIPWKFTR